MKRFVLLVVLVLTSSPAWAQTGPVSLTPTRFRVTFAAPAGPLAPAATFAPVTHVKQDPSGHRGFTAFVNLGLGVQRDDFYHASATGLGGLNAGIGGFINEKMAILGRFSGTNVDYGFATQVSGVYAATLQYWINNRISVEGGGGLGYWLDDGSDIGIGLGLVVGLHASVFTYGSHHIRAGFEYAPVFTDPNPVHNIGFLIGYQFVKSR